MKHADQHELDQFGQALPARGQHADKGIDADMLALGDLDGRTDGRGVDEQEHRRLVTADNGGVEAVTHDHEHHDQQEDQCEYERQQEGQGADKRSLQAEHESCCSGWCLLGHFVSIPVSG